MFSLSNVQITTSIGDSVTSIVVLSRLLTTGFPAASIHSMDTALHVASGSVSDIVYVPALTISGPSISSSLSSLSESTIGESVNGDTVVGPVTVKANVPTEPSGMVLITLMETVFSLTNVHSAESIGPIASAVGSAAGSPLIVHATESSLHPACDASVTP